ncbi:hypothetical protein GACE_1863 [Geoglobus acetivorans]|uniref:Uncharacterized protein n=1 Tax=Geoglobus acetivorans TaxID=565033 RepID=A0A0A7GFP6_GEOAI|nr:hypothetical protein GACE_1863 [Geoglobus acetivorans]
MIAKNISICRFTRDFAFTKFNSKFPKMEERSAELGMFGIEGVQKAC